MTATRLTTVLGVPPTRDGVEWALVLAFLGIRAFDLTQTALAMATGSLAASTAPAVDLGLTTAMALESVLLGGWLWRRGSLLPLRWPIAADFVLALVWVLSVPVYLPPLSRVAVWTMWAYPVTLSTVALIGGVMPRLWQVLAASGILGLGYVAVVAVPLTGSDSGRATGVANALAYPGFALVSFLFCRFVRRLADAADTARHRVRELERGRSRALVHDLLVYLRLDRFAEADDETRVAMVTQARRKYEQMRAYVDGTDDDADLEAHLRLVLGLHPLLATRHVVDVERGIRLPRDAMEQLGRAVDTALANVEQHAPGAEVVVTLRADRDQVAVTVHDNGPGFDPGETGPGYGIAEILGRQLELVGGHSVVTSSPGEGTDISITIPTRP
jgi:signal transduction histidine kinase